jgi:hypothetical protein
MIDLGVIVAGLGVPALLATYTVWTHPSWKGVLLATGTLWILPLMLLVALMVPYRSGDLPVAVWGVWLLWGWAVSALCCTVLARVRAVRLRRVPSTQEPNT